MEGKKKIAIMAVPNPRVYSLTAEQLKELEADKDQSKNEFIDSVVRGKVSDNVLNFLKIIVDKGRAAYLEEILKDFDALGNEKLNIKEGTLHTAHDLTKDQVKLVEKSISERLGQEVHLKVVKDPGLIAGIKVIVNDKIFDNSIIYKLTELKNTLRKVGDA